jgi:acetyl esterase/lipase
VIDVILSSARFPMRRLIAAVLLVFFAATTSGRAAAPPRPVSGLAIKEALDVRYFPGKDRQTLDVFSPCGRASERFPVVIFVHGGTWMFGDKNFFGMYRGVGRFLAKNGIVGVMVNYRLSPRVQHPEHVKDIARAYAWTCKNIDRYGGDPQRIVLAGHSAGGHLVSLLATDQSYLKDPALKLCDADRAGLCGVVAVSGVYRIPAPDEFRKMVGRIVEIQVERRAPEGWGVFLTPVLLKVGEKVNPFVLVFGRDREVQTKASPLSHVRKGLPPFLLLTAEYEVPGLKPMAEDFAAALRKAGNQVQLKQIDDCTHRSIVTHLHSEQEEAGKALLEFVRRHTRKKPAPSS